MPICCTISVLLQACKRRWQNILPALFAMPSALPCGPRAQALPFRATWWTWPSMPSGEKARALVSWMLMSGNEDALEPIVETIH